jgi:D-sedoheptulose 7-phosphate isomerase
MTPLCDYFLCIPSDVTMYIQQAHLALEHIFCALVEREYFGSDGLKAHGEAAAPGN